MKTNLRMKNRPIGHRLPKPENSVAAGGGGGGATASETTSSTAQDPAAPPGPAGGDNTPFYAEWPDDLKAHVQANQYPDILEIVRADMHGQKLHGVPHNQLIRTPVQGFDVNPDAHVQAMRKLGGFETVDQVRQANLFAPIEGLGELKPELQTSAADMFTKAALTPWQAKIVMDGYAQMAKSVVGESQAATSEAETQRAARLDAYKAERGANYDRDIQGVTSMLRNFDRPVSGQPDELAAAGHLRADGTPKGELEAYLDETGLGNDSRLIRFLAEFSSRLGSSGFVQEGGNAQAPGQISAAQAQAELAALEADPGFMKQLMTSGDPHHKTAVARRVKLIELSEGA